jgi:protein tyrosine phosphatase (PTP) superfamily phosphohydrolase (DUF442 family)
MRFNQVDQCLARGPRPEPEDFAYIRDTFSTVISLEGLAEDAKEIAPVRPALLISRPILFWEIYVTGISQVAVDEVLQQIALSGGPCLVHCQHGEDRTGLVVAAYRVRMCGWDKSKAMVEALHFGYRRWANWGLNKTWDAFQP